MLIGCNDSQDKQADLTKEIILIPVRENKETKIDKLVFINGNSIQLSNEKEKIKCSDELKKICDVLSRNDMQFEASIENYYPQESGKTLIALFSQANQGNCCPWKNYILAYYYNEKILLENIGLDGNDEKTDDLKFVYVKIKNNKLKEITAYTSLNKIKEIPLYKNSSNFDPISLIGKSPYELFYEIPEAEELLKKFSKYKEKFDSSLLQMTSPDMNFKREGDYLIGQSWQPRAPENKAIVLVNIIKKEISVVTAINCGIDGNEEIEFEFFGIKYFDKSRSFDINAPQGLIEFMKGCEKNS